MRGLNGERLPVEETRRSREKEEELWKAAAITILSS
jgi:hypothetical protein